MPAGTLLDLVPEGADETGWVRVATWDDRRGWIPSSRLMEQSQWAHYGQALGGVAPSLLRPGYPVEGGVWGVEAPLGTPGITQASTAWLVGDSVLGARVTAIDSLEDICSEELHRFGILDARFSGENLPRLEEGRLVTPSGSRPTTRRLAAGPLDPDAELAGLLDGAARELAPPGADPEAASVEWAALGEGAAWAALSWPAEDPSTGRAQLASAIVFRRTRRLAAARHAGTGPFERGDPDSRLAPGGRLRDGALGLPDHPAPRGARVRRRASRHLDRTRRTVRTYL